MATTEAERVTAAKRIYRAYGKNGSPACLSVDRHFGCAMSGAGWKYGIGIMRVDAARLLRDWRRLGIRIVRTRCS